MKNNQISFLLLIAAFIISAAYQYYRSTINEIAEYDAFGKNEMIRFAVLMGISFFALVNRSWSKWITLAFCVFCFSIVLVKYYPNIYVLRENKMIDVVEPVVYLILVFLAGAFSLPRKKK